MTTTEALKREELRPPRRTRLGAKTGLVAGTGLVLTALTLTGCAASHDQLQVSSGVTDTNAASYSYSGAVETYSVPDGVTVLTVSALGGAGGSVREEEGERAAGAQVSGTVAVQTGQLLLISVGQQGQSAGDHDKDPLGGWGGLGATGGNGNAASDTLRTSGAGGGATTIQLSNADGSGLHTILIAGGGGGMGGVSGDPEDSPYGGSGGCVSTSPWWPGSNGYAGSGGKGGAAAGQSAMAGGRGWGGSEAGGNGGGGGGGLNGGNGGGGASTTLAGGGGGAGSSITLDMLTAQVSCGATAGNGQVVVTPQTS